jgi:predicted dehydrogenase
VFPALTRIGVTRIDVASRTGTVRLPETASGRVFASYDDALRDSEAALVYVSTRNHDHAACVRAALETGHHVVVDKPAALSLADSERLAAEARGRGLLLAEANVYAWHPQFAVVRALMADRGPVTLVNALFCFPWIPRPNYRYEAACGGGILWDLGAYAVSCGRVLFGEKPRDIAAIAVVPEGEEVDTAFSVLMRYSNDRVLTGHFGMPFAYVNRIDLYGPRLIATLERAFTTPADAPVRVIDSSDGRPVNIEVPPADAFAHFLGAVRDAIRAGAHDRFIEPLLTDASVLDQLRLAASSRP